MENKKKLKPRLPGEIVFSLMMLLFGLTALWESYRISGFSSWSSPGSVPMWTSLFMSVSAIVILWDVLRKPSLRADSDNSLFGLFYQIIFPFRHLLFTVVIVLYMVLLEPLGFIISSFLYLTISSLVLGEKRYMRLLLINLLALAAVYLVFQTAFSVVLPEGPFERLLR